MFGWNITLIHFTFFIKLQCEPPNPLISRWHKVSDSASPSVVYFFLNKVSGGLHALSSTLDLCVYIRICMFVCTFGGGLGKDGWAQSHRMTDLLSYTLKISLNALLCFSFPPASSSPQLLCSLDIVLTCITLLFCWSCVLLSSKYNKKSSMFCFCHSFTPRGCLYFSCSSPFIFCFVIFFNPPDSCVCLPSLHSKLWIIPAFYHFSHCYYVNQVLYFVCKQDIRFNTAVDITEIQTVTI